ncbi:MAG: menaquinone biosynthesis protein [Phycisphaerae bacterium]|nr:menaquinone biosynthesis protein [Phycisphaerae bacterium]
MIDKSAQLSIPTYRLGVVRFFNARPLIYGLQNSPGVELWPAVPADLGEKLDAGAIDVALVPSIDYQLSKKNWEIMPAGAIGSLGEVLTVRVFSIGATAKIKRLICDTDSHTSVMLARIIWKLRYGREVEIIRGRANQITNEALETDTGVLLIGDKVLGHLRKWPYELDLGQAWDEMTGLPFVYAFWAVREGFGSSGLAGVLKKAWQEGMGKIDQVVDQYADRHGFTAEVAKRYLTENICFDFGPAQQQGLQRFYQLAYESGYIPQLKVAMMR